MNTKELVEAAKIAAPDELKGLQNKSAGVLIAEVFKQISNELEKTNEGVVRVHGLGQFRVKQVSREKEGQKVEKKMISFRAGTSKSKKKGDVPSND
jgi:nucleoid DNA-binding protein